MAHVDIKSALPASCAVVIPTPHDDINSVVSRWSDAGVESVYAVVTPSSESDITAVIAFAAANQLRIIPTNGGHASFISIDSRTIYLDLSAFRSVNLDEDKGEVRIGGGCTAGDVLNALKGSGWYTTTPNSNPVGMVGAFLGGLSHAANGAKGFGIDHARSISIIPFSFPDGEPKGLVLTPQAIGEEKKLWNVLCGAGHGFGIITSLTLKAWKTEEQNLTDGKVWVRTLIFPAQEIRHVAHLFALQLLPRLPPAMTPVLVFARAPPSAPNAGAPVIILSVTYYGPAAEAEMDAMATLQEDIVRRTISATTTMTERERTNDASAPLNRHGGFKEYHSALCGSVSLASIVTAFTAWENFTGEDIAGRGASYVVIGSWSTSTLIANAGAKDERFFPARDRGVFVQVTPWYKSVDAKEAADAFGKASVATLRENDRNDGVRDWAFANNLLIGMNMEEVYDEGQIEEIRRVKKIWDGRGLGWNPAVEGW